MMSVTALDTARPKSDEEVAQELKARLQPLLDVIVAEMNEADHAGFIVSFNVQRNAYGRFATIVEILKRMA